MLTITPQSDDRRRASARGVVPDAARPIGRGERAILVAASLAIGIGLPFGWMAIARPDSDAPEGPGSAFVLAVGGVAVSYVALVVLGAVIATRTRARSRARRMRQPWERGLTEWQPTAWTYHRFEEVLIGAALVSVVVCMALFVTIGGFAG